MTSAFFVIPALILPLILIWAVIRFIRGRRYSAGESMQLIGGLPSGPSLPGTAYLFPGRGAPPDPDVRPTATTLIDDRPKAPLPDGIRESKPASES